tara:strand:- start:1144 stop:1368 length:225 start_codon:yes stop_codon:yes gene_type:complete
MNIEDKLDLMLIEHDIIENLFIGERYMAITDKYGRDTIISLCGTHDPLLYKWDIDKCEERAASLIYSFQVIESI